MEDEDKNNWALDSLRDCLGDHAFFGRIELNVTNGSVITVSITRTLKPPKK